MSNLVLELSHQTQQRYYVWTLHVDPRHSLLINRVLDIYALAQNIAAVAELMLFFCLITSEHVLNFNDGKI